MTFVLYTMIDLICCFKSLSVAHLIHCIGFFFQYPLGLFDTNETKTADMIQLLRDLQSRYVPFQNDEIVESVFFGGKRCS